eukprot:6176746-Pleurochrysis_carterae.AAC.3
MAEDAVVSANMPKEYESGYWMRVRGGKWLRLKCLLIAVCLVYLDALADRTSGVAQMAQDDTCCAQDNEDTRGGPPSAAAEAQRLGGPRLSKLEKKALKRQKQAAHRLVWRQRAKQAHTPTRALSNRYAPYVPMCTLFSGAKVGRAGTIWPFA